MFIRPVTSSCHNIISSIYKCIYYSTKLWKVIPFGIVLTFNLGNIVNQSINQLINLTETNQLCIFMILVMWEYTTAIIFITETHAKGRNSIYSVYVEKVNQRYVSYYIIVRVVRLRSRPIYSTLFNFVWSGVKKGKIG